ncbi:MAG TPA: flagellar basal body L-ring protein FlgH [Candidatus Binatia bacterium]|nr:flagellar basal body L-ring protein FlgH [Candidatus Binatia bacterium]
MWRTSLGLAWAVLALAPAAPAADATPSLWAPTGPGGLLGDLKARRAGDVLTIVVDERSSASRSLDTSLSRKGDFQSRLTPPTLAKPDWLAGLLDDLARLGASGASQSTFQGTGSQDRTEVTRAMLTVRVVRVLDNGLLLVEGRRMVTVADEAQTLVVSGLVRPEDVGDDNTVLSSRVAEADVRLEGRGSLTRRQRPGIFQRLFDWLGL